MKKFTLNNIFDNDRWLRVFSVLAALVAWFVITIYISPDTEKIVRSVPISTDLTGTNAEANNLMIIWMSQQTVDVEIQGKSYNVATVVPDDIIVTMELSMVSQPYLYQQIRLKIEQNPESSNKNFEIIQETITIQVEFDHIVQRSFTVDYYAPNIEAAENLYLEQHVTTSPSELTVTGPETVMNSIEYVRLETEMNEVISVSTTYTGDLKFYDADDKEVASSYLTYPEAVYTITIPVYERVTVPLTFAFINTPSNVDENEIRWTMDLEEIELGAEAGTTDIPQEISVGSIDFRRIGIGEKVTFDIPIPEGFTNNSDETSVTVEFATEGMSEVVLNSENLIKSNEPSGYNVEVLTNSLNNIVIVGEEDVIDNLTSSDIIVNIDLSNVTASPGQKQVNVTISLSGKKQAWAYGGEYTVLVEYTEQE